MNLVIFEEFSSLLFDMYLSYAFQKHSLTNSDIYKIVKATDGYSGADMSNLCRDAAIGPIRSLDYSKIADVSTDDIRAIHVGDFENSLRQVKASVSDQDLDLYRDWNERYGCAK